ncbi:MAG: hypothetical protein KA419_04900 [Acidobacteria bacterium]|nr:hypothetical protein [Acidobacteriota bacterium]
MSAPSPPRDRCTQCGRAFRPGEPMVRCTACGHPYHPECWNSNGRCGLLGCSGTPSSFQAFTSVASTADPAETPADPPRPVPAPRPGPASPAPNPAETPEEIATELYDGASDASPEPSPDGGEVPGPPPGFTARVREIYGFIQKNETLLWWMHSGWALLFGIGVMWLGAHNFDWIRLAGLYIGFIWLSSLMLPVLLKRLRVTPRWKERIRLVINYFNRNFTQQIVFFIIPIYWKSATANSRNMIFVFLLVVSAILSSLDIVYDRYITVKWAFFSTFFAFNVFSGSYLLFTLIWGLSNRYAVYLSAGAAIFTFASLCFRLSGSSKTMRWVYVVISSFCLLLAAHFGRYIIPPAPLHFGRVLFAEAIELDPDGTEVVRSALSDLPVNTSGKGPGKIYSLIPVKSPLGLKEDLVQIYYLNGRKVYNVDFVKLPPGAQGKSKITPISKVDGEVLWKVAESEKSTNRPGKYELISCVAIYHIPPNAVLTVDVETESGQLIGRDELIAEKD